jgi:hypothetical protein
MIGDFFSRQDAKIAKLILFFHLPKRPLGQSLEIALLSFSIQGSRFKVQGVERGR